MAELATFWNHQHPLAAIAEEKYAALVPSQGHCETLQGELLRASNRIGYDWFNNGWGCNNWSGAVVFIGKHFEDLPNQPAPEVVKELKHLLNQVHEQSHGEPVHLSDASAELMVTKLHAIIVQALIDNPEPIKNPCDMFEYQEDQYIDRSDDEDEDDGYF